MRGTGIDARILQFFYISVLCDFIRYWMCQLIKLTITLVNININVRSQIAETVYVIYVDVCIQIGLYIFCQSVTGLSHPGTDSLIT